MRGHVRVNRGSQWHTGEIGIVREQLTESKHVVELRGPQPRTRDLEVIDAENLTEMTYNEYGELVPVD